MTKCTLCNKEIKNYNLLINHLQIDECHEADICPDCIEKILKWQQTTFANLFPTKAAKKYLNKSSDNKKGVNR